MVKYLRQKMATLDGKEDGKKICTVCRGNGFVRVPYSLTKEEQWADCEFCNNQGEVNYDGGSGTSGSNLQN